LTTCTFALPENEASLRCELKGVGRADVDHRALLERHRLK